MHSDKAGLVATEALLVTVAFRFLQSKFPNAAVERGDGVATFRFEPQDSLAKLSDVVSNLCQTFVKELTGRAKVPFGNGHVDFGVVKSGAVSFAKYMEDSSFCSGLPSNLDDLPDHPGIKKMLDHLYNESNAERTESMNAIKDFPRALCATGDRLDVVLAATVVVRSYSSHVMDLADDAAIGVTHDSNASGYFDQKAAAVIVLETRALSRVLAPYSAAPVEQQLPQQWRQRSFSLDEASEVLHEVYLSLRSFWNSNTHTEKTRVNAMSLLAIVSGDTREYLKEQILIESSDLAGPWRMPRVIIEKCLALCVQWESCIQKLQNKEWEDWGTKHPFRDEAFEAFLERLKSVKRVRTLHDHAVQLLGRVDLSDTHPETIFSGLSLTDPKHTSNEKWSKAVGQFDQAFAVLESSLIGRTRSLLQQQQGEQLVRVASQFIVLLQREGVRSALSNELRGVGTHFMNALSAAQARFESAIRTHSVSNHEMTVHACSSLDAGVSLVMEVAQTLLADSPQLKEIIEKSEALHKTATDQVQATSEKWKVALEKLGDSVAGVTEAVRFISKEGGYIHCQPHKDVAGLLSEVRLVQAMGLASVNVSHTTLRTCDQCDQWSRVTTRLQQQLSAYNSLLRQVLPCTRQLLDAPMKRCLALVFSAKAVQESTIVAQSIAFSSVVEAESLCSRFQSAIEAFSSENRSVRRLHSEFTQTVIGLYSVDLLKKSTPQSAATTNPQWDNAVAEMKSRLSKFEMEHRRESAAAFEPWKRHWDYQLYKALEYQYRRGLDNLNESVSDFTAEIVFKQGNVQFKPGFEQLREQYYQKIRTFLEYPSEFKGVGQSEFFKSMPGNNGAGIETVYQKATELFRRVDKVRKQFREYVVIGCCGTNGAPDLEYLVECMVTELSQWEDGLKMCNDKLRKLTYVEDKIVIDCITISAAPIKASIEDQLHKLEDALGSSLRRTAQKKLSEIDEFLFFASNIIERHPTTLEEVGKANRAYNEFQEQLPAMEALLKKQIATNKLLKTATGASVDMAITLSRWEHLMDAMASHHKSIETSISKMRTSVDAMVAKFLKDLQRFVNNWNTGKPKDVASFKSRQEFVEKGLNYVKEVHTEFQEILAAGKEMAERCGYFRIAPPDLHLLREAEQDINQHLAMWSFYETFETELCALRSEDWLTFRNRLFTFEDFVKTWQDKLKENDVKSDGQMQHHVVSKFLTQTLDSYVHAQALLKFVRGEGMLTEHWNEMFRLLDIDKGMTSDKLAFGNILEKHQQLVLREKEIKGLHARVQGEVQIREALQELRTWAMESNFTLIAPSDASGVVKEGASKVMLITEWKDVMTQVSDHQALLSSLKDSSYYPRFADEASGWEAKLLAVSEYVLLLNNIQRKWVYLEPLFARGALPQELPRFKRVDKEFVGVMKEVETDPRVMSLAQHSDYSEKLKGILEQIDRCQRALNEFLEQKRDKFPRFYFISDEDLLEILGQSKNPVVIQSHLKKLFAGINSVQFAENKQAITHMVSADGEVVALSAPVSITDNNVEDWLIRLDTEMRKTLRSLLTKCLAGGVACSATAIAEFPSQILQVAEQIFFTRVVEQAIPSGNAAAVRAETQKKLDTLTSIDITKSVVMELKTKALILDVIHCLEICDLLVEKSTRSLAEWWWQKHLRYYADDTVHKGGCTLRMVDTHFEYTFEYQGNAAKLVHTPLTDKCYLTLTKGMHLGYGGNPYGPAGTGKTESVKALGSAMGRQVLVFNCDEGIDFKAMGRIFVGLVKCGAWGCFDEFNRLKVDQLSAISQMIQVIQEALKNGEKDCQLLGRTIDVNPNSGIFVTLNPAGKGYGGRSKLPDNLKQLFRAVAMSAPDNELITATMLLSEGFHYARQISRKVVEVFRLSKQLLSQQQHYDWGLRPLKAVLRLGGTLVQQLRRSVAGEHTESQEAELLVQSLRVNTLSKLTFDDARLFSGLIADIFPGVAVREISYAELSEAVRKSIQELGLQVSEPQVHKVLQLYEALNQRMGVVLVGPSGSGKSTLLKILRKAMQSMKIEVPLHAVNPKAMNRQQLLGYMDADTREWFDGVLSAAARKVVKEAAEVKSWIFCDGDIDPEWIESLNSVLDDNKLLTMPNGVRIQFGANVNFVFETHSLEFASPATVSRMGIIFLSEEDVRPEFVVRSFLSKLAEPQQKLLGPLIENVLFKAVDEILSVGSSGGDGGSGGGGSSSSGGGGSGSGSGSGMSVPITRMGLLNIALTHISEASSKLHFVSRLVHGLGSVLNPSAHREFALKMYNAVGERPVDTQAPLETYWSAEKSKLVAFSFAESRTAVDPAQLMSGGVSMIPTVDVQRVLHALEPLINGADCRPFFLVGPEGCGKSMILSQCFEGVKGVKVATIHCNAQTNAQTVMQKLTQMCTSFSTNHGRVLRPKECDRVVLCLKDLNLPKPDRYATVQLHSFLQQLLLYQGFYDSELEWVGVERVQIVGSMNPVASAGRFAVASRLLAIVNIVSLAYPDQKSLVQIYTAFFKSLLSTPALANGNQYDNGKELAVFATTMFDKIKRRFEGEDYAHCVFSPRDITDWMRNVLRYDLTTGSVSVPEVLAYEASRIFSDRLHRSDDRSRAEKLLSEQLSTIGYAASREEREQKIFVSWFSEWSKDGSKLLTQRQLPEVQKEITDALVRFGREFKELNIPLIPEVVQWITRIDRVISKPGGHVLLVGRAGVGRLNGITIAAYLLRMEMIRLNMTRGYGVKQFRMDLRSVIQKAGVNNERVVLLIEDHNIAESAFLEMLNSLISSGEVPALFTTEELEPLMSPLREEAAGEGYAPSAVYSYFLRRVMNNLRVCFIMDAKNELFIARTQANPALLTRCSVLWMGTWSNEGMRMMAKSQVREAMRDLEKNGGDSGKSFQLHHELLAIHQSQGERATPGNFQNLLSSYMAIYNNKAKAATDGLTRLETGLAKLLEAESSVDKIRREVGEKKVEMEKKQQEADTSLTEIQQNMADSTEQRVEAEELTKRLDVEQKDIVVKKARVQDELAGIQPTLDAAREAVGGIKSEHLNEIRAFKTPPEPIRDVLEGVLALLGVSDTSWQSMRKFLGERGVTQRIIEFDAHSITPAIRENAMRLLQQKAQSFKHETIVRASVAAAPLAGWVKANVEYSAVLDRIGPLTNSLNDLERTQQEGKEKLDKLQKKLKKIDIAVEQLRKDFASKCKEAERLKDKLEKAEKQLGAAEELLDKLSGEKLRWSADTQKIRSDLALMPRRALLSAGFLSYLAKAPEDLRASFLTQWRDKAKLEAAFSFSLFMRTESQLLKYKAEGLPGDQLSMENSVVILDSLATPLVIDPANQAVDWLREHLKAKDVTVEVASMYDDRFVHTLELAIRFGKTLLVTEVDRIEPLLFPVLRRDLLSLGPKKVVQLGNKQVDWQESFKIILLTRSTDLHLTPDSKALLTEVNFTVTRSGLESQLLGLTIKHERPELEEQKVAILQKEEGLKMQLAQLEESLLYDLAHSHGSLLDNTTLISSLNRLKTQAQSIQEALVESKKLQEELDAKRDVYSPFAHKGSVMFFLIKDLESSNRMYQVALADFLFIFQQALAHYSGSDNIVEKIAKLSLVMAQESFLYVSRGLFKADRVSFGVHVLRGFFPEDYPSALWDVFTGRAAGGAGGVGGGGSVSSPTTPQQAPLLPVPAWVPATSASFLSQAMTADEGIAQRWNISDEAGWTPILQEETPESTLERRGLTNLDLLLALAAFRRDRLVAAMTSLVLSRLQLPGLSKVASLEAVLPETTPDKPILLITSSGADPSIEVQEVAYKTIGRDKFTQIALGGGQTDEAMAQLRRCSANGEWLFLKNLHLVLDWVSALEKEILSMPRPHDNFRLWLTTESHDLFPSVLAKCSLKLTVEAPPGMKQNMLRSYGAWTPEFISQRTDVQSGILFALAWFHAVAQERRSFIPQGWVKFYEFTQADMKAASDVLVALTKDTQGVRAGQGGPDWITINGMLESAVYGGRLDNDQDVAVLRVLLSRMFSPQTVGGERALFKGGMSVPRSRNHAEIMRLIDTISATDLPSTFELPDNADRVVQEALSNKYRTDLRNLAQRTAGALKGAEGYKTTLAPILEAFASLKMEVPANAPALSAEPDPIENFFVSELRLVQRLVKTVVSVFAELKRVADGVALPSAELAGLAAEIVSGVAPDSWVDRMNCGTESLIPWLTVLARKDATVRRLLAAFNSGTMLQEKLNLSDFLRPHTFFNALRQHTARKTGAALVDLTLAAYTNPRQMPTGSVMVTLDGSKLLVQGASVSGERLLTVPNTAPSTSPFVDVNVAWGMTKPDMNGFVPIPLYTTPSREVLLMSVNLPCSSSDERDSWILSGAALFITVPT